MEMVAKKNGKKIEYRDKNCHFCYLAGFLLFVLIAYRSTIVNSHMLAYKEHCMNRKCHSFNPKMVKEKPDIHLFM